MKNQKTTLGQLVKFFSLLLIVKQILVTAHYFRHIKECITNILWTIKKNLKIFGRGYFNIIALYKEGFTMKDYLVIIFTSYSNLIANEKLCSIWQIIMA